jgi:hypothetical protein
MLLSWSNLDGISFVYMGLSFCAIISKLYKISIWNQRTKPTYASYFQWEGKNPIIILLILRERDVHYLLVYLYQSFSFEGDQISPNIFISVVSLFGIWIEASWKYYFWKTDTNWKSTLIMLDCRQWCKVIGMSRVYEVEPRHLELFLVYGDCPFRQPALALGKRLWNHLCPTNAFNYVVHHLVYELPSLSLFQDQLALICLDVVDLKNNPHQT